MKTTSILLSCILGLIGMIHAEDHSPLGQQMESLNDAFKAFRNETDPAKGAALARESQQYILKSLAETPSLVTKMPDGPDKSKAAAEYRKMLGKVYVVVCEVEEAFLAGKIDEVAKHVGILKDLKKAGHEKFMEEEE